MMETNQVRLPRRQLGLALAGAAAATAFPAALSGQSALAAESVASRPVRSRTIRFGVVGALQTGGLLNQLIASFQQRYPYTVELSAGNLDALFTRARAGELDLVATHVGVAPLRDFVSGRFGRWPQQFMGTSFTLLAAPDDPAGVADLTDPVAAFGQIAATGAPFVVNDLDSPRFITEVLWNAAGAPERSGWYLDTGLRAAAAAREAARLGGYTIWGLHPFRMLEQQPAPTGLRPQLFRDPLFQRVTGTVVVNPSVVRGVNATGALLLERHLLDPASQGRIQSFRLPDLDLPVFWPAAHHNATD